MTHPERGAGSKPTGRSSETKGHHGGRHHVLSNIQGTLVYQRSSSLLLLYERGQRTFYSPYTSSPMTLYLEDVSLRYYRDEHESAYRKIEQRGYNQWNDLFDQSGAWTYDFFQNRAFLERIIPALDLPAASVTSVLEYGCGTGPAACFLAGLGFHVEAIDLIPEAISVARRMASERGVHVAFSVADICALASEPVTRSYDLVLDSFCLQSIVSDQDRAALFSAVRARMKPNAFYVISTALRVPGREDEPDFPYEASTGILYREVPKGAIIDQVVEIDGRSYIPHRRHLSAEALRDELVSAGFHVLSLETTDSADVVCCLDTSKGKVIFSPSS